VSATGGPAGRAVTATAWYVYGVVPAEIDATVVDGLRGVGGGRVSIVAGGNLGALAGEVPLAEFDDEPLAANLRDSAWLEAGVRAHDAVLAAVVGEVPVVPFRFGTIYRAKDQVQSMLAEHPGLGDALEAVRGRVELGVKGFFVGADDDLPATGEAAAASPGRRYLEQKQQARRAAEAREALLARAADESHARLAAVSADARANALQPAAASERAAAMFLNGAYLVEASNEAEFRRTLRSLEDELAPAGIAFELTGPWPPYNFVEVDA
jgi:hypothetical protein